MNSFLQSCYLYVYKITLLQISKLLKSVLLRFYSHQFYKVSRDNLNNEDNFSTKYSDFIKQLHKVASILLSSHFV